MGAPQELQFRQRVGYQTILLGGFTTLATALLVAGNLATRDTILDRQKEDLQGSLSQVIPSGRYDNNLLDNPLELLDLEGDPVTVYRGTNKRQVNTLAWEVSSQGYSGEIRLILGLDAQGEILGVRVLSHTETPGLGDKIEVEKDDWMLQFNGLSLGKPPAPNWKVKKDGGQFDGFSGATITPRAVLQAIEGGLEFFKEYRIELLDPPVMPAETDPKE